MRTNRELECQTLITESAVLPDVQEI